MVAMVMMRVMWTRWPTCLPWQTRYGRLAGTDQTVMKGNEVSLALVVSIVSHQVQLMVMMQVMQVMTVMWV